MEKRKSKAAVKQKPSKPASQKLPEIIDNLPNICGSEDVVLKHVSTTPAYLSISKVNFQNVSSSFGVALHMHQPTIPAGGGDLQTAGLISNLQDMMNNQGIGDNHNAPVFVHCYTRISDLIREKVSQDKNPRIMLDYSGNLLWGLRQMGEGGVLDNLKLVTCDKNYFQYVEWLGTMWSHAVVTSTPVPDIKRHILAWRHNFAAIFGLEALERVKGFSPPEMHLPIHPDVCYEYIKALKECGYTWLMVQEHTIENVDGSGVRDRHFPHKMVAKNSAGEVQEITVLIKTQGSDNKLIGQMQPYYEAKSVGRQDFAGKNIIPFVCQIGDGENGGVIMNEFPPMFRQVYDEVQTQGVVGLNGSEYLEYVESIGIDLSKLPAVQPISQNRIWQEIKKFEPHAADKAIDEIKKKDSGYDLDKGSWTNDRSWVKGYEDVTGPVNQLSIEFYQKTEGKALDTNSKNYREALLLLMLSQTSCFRYWGSGAWTDYAKEITRRGREAVKAL